MVLINVEACNFDLLKDVNLFRTEHGMIPKKNRLKLRRNILQLCNSDYRVEKRLLPVEVFMDFYSMVQHINVRIDIQIQPK